MERFLMASGAVVGFVGIAAGAFGAHALRTRITPDMLDIYETAVRYQMYHAIALLLAGFMALRLYSPALTAAGLLFLAGIVIFSGSLYLLALTGARWWGAVTPIGGLAFLAGWLSLAWASLTAMAR
ncbi:MAG: DUF423 domain-containing protein [Acidobacteria bacterium]|nr:MAG: DUF423 domain-containing protein [Acidobacteriota bacterium]